MLAPLLALSLGTAAGSPLVLYPLQSKGLDAATTRAIDAALRAQIESMERFDLFSLGDTRSVLRPPEGGLGLSCGDGADDCLAGVGRLLSGAVVAFGVVSPEDAELWLVDAKSSAEVRRVRIRGAPLEAAREAAVALLTPDRYVGMLAVAGNRGRVAVDGVSRGDLPLPSPLVEQVGRHVVTVTISGEGSWDESTDVGFGQTTEVSPGPRASAASTPPPSPLAAQAGSGTPLRTASYVTLAAGVLSVGAGIACAAVSANNADALRSLQRPIPLGMYSVVNQDAQRTTSFALAADVLFGAAAILGVTGVVLYLVGGNHAESAAKVKVNGSGVSFAF